MNIVNQNSAASDWGAARGEKWRAQLMGMEAMLAPVDPVLIQALDLDRPYRIADLACGGGGTTAEILRRAPAGTIVHGFDISPTLIEVARARSLPDKGSIAFEVANLATAAAPKEPYDRLSSRFGVMFFDDPQAAFTNLFDWLAPSEAATPPASLNIAGSTVEANVNEQGVDFIDWVLTQLAEGEDYTVEIDDEGVRDPI
jgi:trans-aconitate methyltransferase